MKNIFINDYRKKLKRNTINDSTEGSYLLTNGAVTFNDGERAFVRNDINTALLKISAELRVPFMMHVKSRIFFARKELSQMLDVYK
jgi:RNA polymerase sigma-70 factor (ECF subfamily)